MGLFGENKKKLKILKLSRDVRYLQKVALKCVAQPRFVMLSSVC